MQRIVAKTVVTAACCIFVLAFSASGAFAQTNVSLPGGKAETVFKDIKVLQGTAADQLIPAMQHFEASLGVTCDFCHTAQREADTPHKTTARQMIAMVRNINKDSFKGRKTVTCNTCHRGSTDPAGNPKLADEKYRPWDPNDENGAPDLPPVAGPPAAQLLDNWMKSLGGEAALAKISSRVVKYTATDTIGRTANMEMVTKGDNGLSITHQGNGDAIIAHNGNNTGWQRAANGATRDIREYELDDSRLQDPLYLATHAKQIFSGLETRRVRLGEQDVYQLRGTAFGHTPVRILFNPSTGNLVRLTYNLQHSIGQNVVRIDYSDYRNVQGTTYPFTWTIARPLGLQTVKVEQVQQNVAVEESRFAKPAPPQGNK